MDRTLRILLAILLITLIPTATVFAYIGYTEWAYRSSFSSTLDYSIWITADAPLENVTLIVPIPVDTNGTSPTLTRMEEGLIEWVPETWNLTLLEAGDTMYLKITANEILPLDDRYHVLYVPDESDAPVETKSPIEKAYVVRPLPGFTADPCLERADEPWGEVCYNHYSALYARYSTDPETRAEIQLKVSGRNEWQVFGWGSTGYVQNVDIPLIGPQQGWQIAHGKIIAGIGEDFQHY